MDDCRKRSEGKIRMEEKKNERKKNEEFEIILGIEKI